MIRTKGARSMGWWLGGTALLIALILAALYLGRADEWLLFYPARYPEGNWHPDDLTFEDVSFSADDGVRLHGWYFRQPQPRAVVLYAHGNAGNLTHRGPIAHKLHRQLGLSVLLFDYRGYGRSEGKPTAAGILRDARAARRYLAQREGIPPQDVVLMGRSIGGAVCVQLAAETPCRALVLESTFASLRDMGTYHFPLLAWAVPRNKLNSLAVIPSCSRPLLASHGDADTVIPWAQGRRLFAAAREPKSWFTVPGGDHNDPQPEAYYDRLSEFLDGL